MTHRVLFWRIQGHNVLQCVNLSERERSQRGAVEIRAQTEALLSLHYRFPIEVVDLHFLLNRLFPHLRLLVPLAQGEMGKATARKTGKSVRKT